MGVENKLCLPQRVHVLLPPFSTPFLPRTLIIMKQFFSLILLRIEDNAYRVAEENYQKKLKAIEAQKQNNEISAERYHQELQQLQDKYEKYLYGGKCWASGVQR